jgi:hypothetical protein
MPIGAVIPMLASILGTGAPGTNAPIYLTTESVAGGVRFQVVGAPSMAFRGSFLLEVNGEGNQSRHQGSAQLRAGDREMLSTVTVGVPEQGKWRARLRVEPAGAEPYEQVATSDDGA